MFPVKKLDLTDNKSALSMEFEIQNGFLPLNIFKINSTDEEKHEFVKNLCAIATKIKSFEKIVTVFDDRNILVNSSNIEIKFLYRGAKGLMPAATYEIEGIETQVKRIALFILTTARFDELRVNGLDLALSKASPERYRIVSKILNSSTLNEIYEIMDELKKLLRHEEVKEIKELVLKENNKSFFSMFSLRKNNNDNELNKEEKVRKLPSKKEIESSQKQANIIFIGSRAKFVVGVIIGAILITFVIYLFSSGKLSNQNVTFAKDQTDQEFITKGLQYAAIQDYQNAADNFEKIKTPFDQLSINNKRAILFSYLMTGRYQRAIEIEPQFSYSVINYLVSKDDIEAVKKINSKEPVIIFEKAAINNDYKTVLKYKDKIELDGRREFIVADAYIALNQLDQGIEFAKNIGNQDLLDKMEALKGTKQQE